MRTTQDTTTPFELVKMCMAEAGFPDAPLRQNLDHMVSIADTRSDSPQLRAFHRACVLVFDKNPCFECWSASLTCGEHR